MVKKAPDLKKSSLLILTVFFFQTIQRLLVEKEFLRLGALRETNQFQRRC